MSPPTPRDAYAAPRCRDSESTVPNVVVVDPRFDAYEALAASARIGKVNLHFRSSGAEGLKIARRRRVDVWLVGTELEDMSGNDFLELLQTRLDGSKAAIITGAAEPVGTARDAIESGADAVLSRAITLGDIEVLLGVSQGDRPAILTSFGAARAFMTLPVGVGAAVMAIAVLMLS